MPLITVLMPVYNAGQFLREAIDSILIQTFTDFEFLIIDDCSTDDSVSIIKFYSDARIRFYQNEENRGISATLNRGIQLANAAWIARMDGDDISHPERLQRQYSFIQQHPDGALYSCWTRVIDQHGKFIKQETFESDRYYYNLIFICWIYHPTIVFKKQAVCEVGMYTVKYAEDFELFWQLTRKYKLYNLEEVLLDYRVTNQSLHMVLKKNEYHEAQLSQLLRNFRYYAGEQYTIPVDYLECLQHNFQPILLKQNTNEVAKCILELDFITKCILATKNVNRDVEAIERAAFFKRKFIVDNFLEHLSLFNQMRLLAKLNDYKYLKRHLKNKVKRYLGQRSLIKN